MSSKIVLILTTDKETFLNTSGVVNSNSWRTIMTAEAEAAIEISLQQDIGVVVLTNEFKEDEKKLKRIISFQQPNVEFIETGNHSETLVAQIKEAIIKQTRNSGATFSIVDDALKEAALPICLQ